MRRRNIPGEPEPPSKSELKRRAQSVQELADRLIAASDGVLDVLPVETRLTDAVREARRLHSPAALARQRLYVAKLLRRIDLAPVRTALDAEDRARLAEAYGFRQCERWRDRLLAEGEAALPELAEVCPGIDLDAVGQLVAEARREAALGQPSHARRRLFRALRAALQPP